jgi:bifunctional enzyme CysN/CysC
MYLLKHAARVVTAELDSSLGLNDIGLVNVKASRPLVFDPYAENRATGSFIVIDPSTNATAGAGMIVRKLDETSASTPGSDAADRLARAARMAATETDAIEAVRRLLEEILT